MKRSLVVWVFLALAGPAAADTLAGLWRTEPDRHGQVAHVQAQQCGSAWCGTIVRVFDAKGQAVDAPTVGQRVFWDMTGAAPSFSGRAYVPAHQRSYNATMEMQGQRMRVSGCLGPVCMSQMWSRVP